MTLNIVFDADDNAYINVAVSDLPQVHEDQPGVMRVWLGDGNLVRDTSWTRDKLINEGLALLAMANKLESIKEEQARQHVQNLASQLEAEGVVTLTDEQKNALIKQFSDARFDAATNPESGIAISE